MPLATVRAHGRDLRFYIDSPEVVAEAGGPGSLEGWVRGRLEPRFGALPASHVRAIAEPFIVVNRLPGGRPRGALRDREGRLRSGGGGWYPPASSGRPPGETVQAWLGAANVANTGVPAAEILSRVGGAGGTGIIAYTAGAFLGTIWPLSLLHEVGHCIDDHLGLTPPRSLPGRHGHFPYQGQSYPSDRPRDYAAEAYSRFFVRPGRMCRGGDVRVYPRQACLRPDGTPTPAGERCPTQPRCSGRLQRDLQATAAFRGLGWTFPLALRAPGEPWGFPPRRYASTVGTTRGPLRADPEEGPAAPSLSPASSWRARGPVGRG